MNRESGKARPLVVLASNSVWNILNFRANLLNALRQQGYSTLVLAPPGEDAAALESEGARFVPTPMSPSGTSPIADARLLCRYAQILRKEKPAAFFGFTAKPNIYGSIAASLCGVPVVNNITGLGTAFIHGTVLERVVSSLYRLALRRSCTIFFHNDDDRQLFVGNGLVREERAAVIPGSGVNLDRFRPVRLPSTDREIRFLFVGRLLWEKGVGEFVEAARISRKAFPRARFRIVGGLSAGSRAVSPEQLKRWEDEGLVDYLGSTDDVREAIADCDCVVLPSYREGLPRAVLEGAAMGRPAIAADVPGSRRAVRHGQTGFLCRVRSPQSLAETMSAMARLTAAERAEMGRRARDMVEEEFDEQRVSDAYLRVLASLSSTT